MGDETEPGIGVEAPTTIHAATPAPDVPLAYSETIELPEPRRWRAPAALFTVAAAALGAALASWFLIRPHTAPGAEKISAPGPTLGQPMPTSSSSAPAPQLSSQAASPRPASGPSAGALPTDSRGLPMLPEEPTPEQQQEVITRFFDHFGIPYADPPAAAIDAQSVCGYLKSGHRRAIDVIMWAQQTHPDLRDVPPAINFVTASIGTYCPQYGYLIAQPNSDATS
jgi:hypothetical protein